MTSKGLATLQSLISEGHSQYISYVVVAQDRNVTNDYYKEIVELAQRLKIPTLERSQPAPYASHLIAVSWRWLIEADDEQKLVVFHDSLLPRYRGFAPLPSALINGDRVIGVTALMASEEYDRGPIITQEAVEIDYPVKISSAIEQLEPCYQKLAIRVAHSIIRGELISTAQNEVNATYSLWRDEQDYFIDWTWDAHRIQRFIDALGFPYKGAATTIDGETFRINQCEVVADVKIENRTAGKIIFMHGNYPVIVCGSGLIKILEMNKDSAPESALPIQKFRTRFF
ncbi:Methionyl-tRNA formyltransferase [Pseudomonas fluorescens]|uniref:Methionyl-tRNA formyltransferase n=2 Tax=Pseudomonas fluorescens TaxID=294 RepID=A0A5E6UE59_PSEFL|nr:Methionyl-tRNA formyltransferase [Pseudomonas fluorescens]